MNRTSVNDPPQADPHALLGREVMYRPLYSDTYRTAKVQGMTVTDRGLLLRLDNGRITSRERIYLVADAFEMASASRSMESAM